MRSARGSHRGGMRRRNTVWLMHLIGVPDASGKPALWINADHLVSVQPVVRTGERDVTLEAELKVDGMPLQRINLGAHADRAAADVAFDAFLHNLQN